MIADDSDPERPLFSDTASWEVARQQLEALELADGLPQTPPTTAHMAAMLTGVAEPDREFGMMPPLFGSLTPRSVAYNCILAGALPGSLPVVMAAALAILQPEFNLLGLLTTTGAPAVATIVHGAAANRLEMNAGTNLLGPGNAANTTLGRSIALTLWNIGGARPGVGDMATMGQPGKLAFCFPDSAFEGFPSLPIRRGLDADCDAVTVLGVSGTVEVLPLDDRDTPEAILAPVVAAMIALPTIAGSGRARPPGEHVLLLPPELAEGLRRHDWGLAEAQDYLWRTERIKIPGVATIERAAPVATSPDDIHIVVTGGPGVKMTYLPLWAGGTRTQTRQIIDLESGNLV